jgi:hypothetical protein
MLKDGSVQFSDYIFREGFEDWEYIYNIAEFDRRILFPGGDQPKVSSPSGAPSFSSKTQDTADDLWYLHDGQSQLGPYSFSYIDEGLTNKTIFWTYYVWKEGFESWIQIKDCTDFDRRSRERGRSPENTGITSDFNEIRQEALTTSPEPSYHEINDSDFIDDEEGSEKTKYSRKTISLLILLSIFVLGSVYVYPKIMEYMREQKANKLYTAGVSKIDNKDNKKGYDLLFDIFDLYPSTKSKVNAQKFIVSKKTMIKTKLSEEAKKIKVLMDKFVYDYRVIPANAIDIDYKPPFFLEYFGEIYYKRTENLKVAVMAKGVKLPVENYIFVINGNGVENEVEISRNEFVAKSQEYMKLIYVGEKTKVEKKKTKVKPKVKAKPKRKIRKKAKKTKSKNRIRKLPKKVKNSKPVRPEKAKPKRKISKPVGDEYKDLINTIRQDM